MNYVDPATLKPGTKVDHYAISGVLGRGGFGITYLVHDESLQKDFALKEFFPEDLVVREGTAIRFTAKPHSEADYRWGLRKFYDEARLLAQFSHPNIVSVRRVFEQNNTAYMLLDFVRGSTLEKWLAGLDSPATQEELDLISAPLLGALELVHANRAWHLDISPDNIMIRASDGAPILLDFGASRFEIKQHSQLVSALVFKSGYSAPEQYTSNADRYGPWTDIYAYAATLYRAISGSRPIEATSRQLADELRPALLVGKGRYRDTFLKAVDRALRLPPHDRPQSIPEWRRELLGGVGAPVPMAKTRVLSGRTRVIEEPLPVEPFRGPEPIPRFAMDSRSATLAAVGGALALFLLAVGLDQIAPHLWLNPVTAVRLAVSKPAPASSRPASLCGGSPVCWGAVAEKGGGVFARVNEPTKAEAETGAMNLCTQRLGSGGCRIISVLSKNECWALAEVPSNPADWRGANGASVEEARATARATCETNYGFCRVGMTFCADGSNRLGGTD
ncbi:MAG TPA: protein kinase [Hyphomicrobiaceae bacterium]|nr:protein kinase [Hyphomicrobiaceae bacterium]